jgi:hypothetical protein
LVYIILKAIIFLLAISLNQSPTPLKVAIIPIVNLFLLSQLVGAVGLDLGNELWG